MAQGHPPVQQGFILYLFDGKLNKLKTYYLPLDVAAIFTNRIVKELFPNLSKGASEPWYKVIPYCSHQKDKKLKRAKLPQGPTSLISTKYEPEKEPPPRVLFNPASHFRFFEVQLYDLKKKIFSGEYHVNDLFLAVAETLMQGLYEDKVITDEDAPFYYEIEISPKLITTMSPDLLPQEAFQVEGVFHLPVLKADRKRIQFTKIKPPPLPVLEESAFGETETKGRGKPGEGRVLMSAKVYDTLKHKIELSDEVEQGGYLLGTPYRLAGSPEDEEDEDFKWGIDIRDIIVATGGYGTALLLLFNGDTWSELKREMDRSYPDKKLLSWYHTHLFKGSDDFGLSGLDQTLHRRFFTLPWQVAILLNLDPMTNEREVRCFQRGPSGELVESQYEVYHEEEK